MSSQLTEEELAALMPSELVAHQTPIPTQIVASDEFYPDPQNAGSANALLRAPGTPTEQM
jgi:hypothetical protein